MVIRIVLGAFCTQILKSINYRNSAVGKIYYLGASRNFDISNIVGTENIEKYTKEDFICVCPNFSTSCQTATDTHDNGAYATGSVSFTPFVVDYDNSTGIVTITDGILTLTVKDYDTDDGIKISITETKTTTISVTPTVFFLDGAEIISE